MSYRNIPVLILSWFSVFRIETVERFYCPVSFEHGFLLHSIVKNEENKACWMSPCR